jgi:hypothetical protein
MCTKFWSENIKGIEHLEGTGKDGNITSEFILGKQGEKLWNGFIWLRTGAGGGLL